MVITLVRFSGYGDSSEGDASLGPSQLMAPVLSMVERVIEKDIDIQLKGF